MSATARIEELGEEIEYREELRERLSKKTIDDLSKELNFRAAEEANAKALARKRGAAVAAEYDKAIVAQFAAMAEYVNTVEHALDARQAYRTARREAMALGVDIPVVESAAQRHAASTSTEGSWDLRKLFRRFHEEAMGLL